MNFYFVTFCAMDQEVEANPFWHSCLLLSCYDEKTKKIEVIENWGFGGVPANSPYTIVRNIKKNLGLDTDFYGNHGLIYAEETRRLEKGYGLHGASFELTQEKFNLLQQKCHKMAQDQEDAINEAVRDLKLKPNPSTKIRNYAYEHESYRIFQHELKKAHDEHRAPRLHEFSLGISSQARTCKAQMLNLLDGIITDEQLKRVTGTRPAVPRMSGPLESIYLHSSGPLYQHKKSSGEIVHYRKSKEAKIYWTLPPQEIETLSDTTRNLFIIPKDQCGEVKKVIRQLQSLEWFFQNANLAESFSTHRMKIINHIIKLYEAFSVMVPKQADGIKQDWFSFWKWVTSQPRDSDEKILLTNLKNAKDFIHNLYMAIVDKWYGDIIKHDHRTQGILNADDPLSLEHKYDIEVIAAYLPKKLQRGLCKIIGRTYFNPNDQLHIEEHLTGENMFDEQPMLRM